ncbi:hypothetical protein [Nitrosomonas sp.]|uniref:hypothetical protein n=1 Tax=Nitrosomonas sp. TaxID=42353 RepID=UPI00374D789B
MIIKLVYADSISVLSSPIHQLGAPTEGLRARYVLAGFVVELNLIEWTDKPSIYTAN